MEQQFVCVRVIRANGLDLNLFQFDYDQTWAVMFLNADRTIYGRYGTRAGGRNEADTHISVAGFKKALERALAAHRGYPANKEPLAAYAGPAAEFATPEQIPGQRANDCIHCHQVHDTLLRHKWEQRQLKAADLFVYPLPEQIGLKMRADDCLLVERVRADSPAAKAGLRASDRIVKLNGVPLLSQADIQWLLHRSPDVAALDVTYERDGRTVDTKVSLSGDWKVANLSWRESAWLALRRDVRFESLSMERRRQLNIARDALAFEIKAMYGPGPDPLRRAGVKVGDIIVGIDGRTDLATETMFLSYLRLKYGPGDKVPLTMIRDGKQAVLEVPAW